MKVQVKKSHKKESRKYALSLKRYGISYVNFLKGPVKDNKILIKKNTKKCQNKK